LKEGEEEGERKDAPVDPENNQRSCGVIRAQDRDLVPQKPFLLFPFPFVSISFVLSFVFLHPFKKHAITNAQNRLSLSGFRGILAVILWLFWGLGLAMGLLSF
jgi:hypothetical protein